MNKQKRRPGLCCSVPPPSSSSGAPGPSPFTCSAGGSMGSNSNSREEILIADLPDGYVTDLGRPYITHKGLIALAHRHGIDSIMTELKAWSNGEAIVKATATGARGTYTGIGDANPDNVGSMLKSACISRSVAPRSPQSRKCSYTRLRSVSSPPAISRAASSDVNECF